MPIISLDNRHLSDVAPELTSYSCQIKAGISGWAQVHGYRGETKDPFLMKKRVRYDVWYIEHWTFWLDLQIITQTLVNMVKGDKNAY